MVAGAAGLRIISAIAFAALSTQGGVHMKDIPASLPAGPASELRILKACALGQIEQYGNRAGESEQKCANAKPGTTLDAWCAAEFAELRTVAASLEQQKTRFNSLVDAYVRAASVEAGSQTVDARVELVAADAVAQVPEIACSPAVTEMRRGFEAVANHDWQLAWAMWATAAKKDPNNRAIERSVDLARFMLDYKRRVPAGKKTATEIFDSPPPPPSDPMKELYEFQRQEELRDMMRALRIAETFFIKRD